MLPAPIISMGGGTSLVLATLLDVALFMALYMMLSWNFYLARDFARRDRVWFPVRASQESLPVFGFHLHLFIEPGLWFSGSYYRLSRLVYLSGLIFLFGAYLSVSYFQLKQQQKETVVEIRQ